MAHTIIVQHEIERPALFGAAAALIAAREGGRVYWPEAYFNLDQYPDAKQHVASEQMLAPSGLVWADRLAGQPALPLKDLKDDAVAVIPLHRAFIADPDMVEKLVNSGDEHRTVILEDSCFRDESNNTIGWYDEFGRVRLDKPTETPLSAPLVFAIAGPARQFFETCPAPLAALADAIDAEAPGSRIRFIDPRQIPLAPLQGVDGLLLPGGSEMAAVSGQIELARVARAEARPTLGLCLGMQSMSTAVARELPEWKNTNMEEVAPDADRHSFVRIETGEHRLGWRVTRPAAGSRMSSILGDDLLIACNHRFRLAPSLHEGLASRGVRVSALGGTLDQNIADAIEAEDGFYMGMQGHPELSSRIGRPHPLISAFVAATKHCAASRRAL